MLYIANWKMQLPFTNELLWCFNNRDELEQLCQQATIVICPSTLAIAPLAATLHDIKLLHIGAQNCSEFSAGAYTGQISANSLAQAGCTYCIVGHSECRSYFGETNDIISNKIVRLLEHDIVPIICVGESAAQHEQQRTMDVLRTQLAPIFTVINNLTTPPANLCIAYEPIWAIGTGKIPTFEHLSMIFSWLQETCQQHLPSTKVDLIYGGSVQEGNIGMLKEIPHIGGFLIGGASTDFQKFKKLVS